MSDAYDLQAILSLNADNYNSGLQNASEKTSGLSSTTIAFGQIAADAVKSVINKFTDLATTIAETGIETEESFAQLETIAGSENIDALSSALLELSSATGMASSDLAITAYNAISAGSSAEDAAGMVESAAKLATAGFTDTDSALSTLSTAINAYGLEADEAESISDSLIQVQNLGVTTIDELASSMGKAISTASAYNVDLGNLESSYVSLTKAGISTEESTTYLSSMLNELGDSGSDVAGIIEEETGSSFSELMDQGYSLGDVMGILYEACDEDSTALMNLWSSAEAGKASNAIVSQGLEEFNENLEAIENSSGATEDAYETMTGTLSYQLSVLKTSFENLGIAVYDKVSPYIAELVSLVNENVIPAIQDFGSYVSDNMLPILQEWGNYFINNIVPVIEGLVETIGGTLPGAISVLYENLNVIVPIISSVVAGLMTWRAAMKITSLMESAKKAIMGVNAAMSANPAALVVTAIAALVAIIVTLWNTNEGFRTAVITIWNKIVQTFQNAWQAIKSAFSTVGSFFSNIWQTIKSVFSPVISWFTNIFKSAVSGIKGAFNTVVSFFKGIWNSIKSVFDNVISFFTNIGSNIVSGIKTGLNNAWNSLLDGLGSLVNKLPKWVKKLLGIASPSKVFAEIGQYIVAGLSEGITDSTSEAVSAAESMASEVLTAVDEMSTGWNAGIEGMITDFESGTVNLSNSALGQISSGSNISVTQNIYSQKQTAADLMKEARWEQQRLVLRSV